MVGEESSVVQISLNSDVLHLLQLFQNCSSMLLWLSVKIVGIIFLAMPVSLVQDWSVTHTPSKICAVHHSSVVLPCKYTYPKGQQVTASLWSYKKRQDAEAAVVSVDWTTRRPMEEAKAEVSDCSLTLSNVTQDSSGIYQFSIRTNVFTHNLTTEEGVELEITGLEVEIVSKSDVVWVGDWVMLICGTCIPSLTVPVYIWHKDGHLHSSRHGDNLLELKEVRLEDAGSYSCTINGHEGLPSSAANFTVKSPPKNVSVSISPSGEIAEGSPVTLTCSSDANPPVQSYTWFKEDGPSPVGSGQNYSLNLNTRNSGWYYCEVQNGHGTLRSASVPIILKTERLILYVAVGGGLCGIAAVLTVAFCLRRKRRMDKQNRKTDQLDRKKADADAKDDTYASLDLTNRCDDVYCTLSTSQNIMKTKSVQ